MNRPPEKNPSEHGQRPSRAKSSLSWPVLILLALVLYSLFAVHRIRERLDETIKVVNSLSGAVAEIQSSAAWRPEVILETGAEDLPKGFYILEAEIRLATRADTLLPPKKFTVYHFKTAIGAGEYSRDFNIGIATSGLGSVPVLYIDYNNDSAADLDIMKEFAQYLPLGRIILRGMNVGNSQRAYNTFLQNYQKASFTSVDEIKKSGGTVAQSLVSFVEQHSKELLDWINQQVD